MNILDEHSADTLADAHLRARALHGADALDEATRIGHAIATAAEHDPHHHPVVVAARVALAVADARRAEREQLRAAARDISSDPAWQGYATRRVPHDELQRRRGRVGPIAPADAA